jgi:integrase
MEQQTQDVTVREGGVTIPPGCEYPLDIQGQGAPIPHSRTSPDTIRSSDIHDELNIRSRAHRNRHTPPNTDTAYERDFALWKTWCQARDLDPAVPREWMLTAFIDDRWSAGIAPATIRRNLSGIAVTARTDGATVERAMVTQLRQYVTALEHVAAVEGEPDRGRGHAHALPLTAVRDIVGRHDLATAAGLRDRTVFCLGFALAARSAELAHLRAGDITRTEQGLVVKVRVSKTGRRTVKVAYGTNPLTCPVRAWAAWQRHAGLAAPWDFVVPQVHRSGTVWDVGMRPGSVSAIVTRRGRAAGYEIPVSGHSLRSGLIVAARAAGKDVKAITDVSGHSPKSGEVYRYLADVDGWEPENNATMGIGL